jgi:hypothetical protein
VLQLARRRFTVYGALALAAQQPPRSQALGDVRGHPMSSIAHALGRVSEMMRHEFQRERLGRRPWQGLADGGLRSGLQIREVRRERPQAILAHAFASEML